ncbi:DUF6011 domain-containing protein [Salipaludibacillus aurantiacus]|uniref:Uncharacterized protein n=1 Tax=Salipaludibacillus aurantiacus TaxID=1601833 RepID=A0A1H9U0T9_9BACI|nr:DUF6011 domain-containing protein [Salipaludibacillus aurantiacus]SES02979.1 hypothetical protein SAMN05518684_106218 [Salipaludibacillus aurantiacus]
MEQHTECIRCGRKLKDKKSCERGYGSVCYRKMLQEEKDFDNQQIWDGLPTELKG